jgi:Four helix bundle sensory module for signal transduction
VEVKPGARDLLWMGAGAAALLVVLLVLQYYRGGQSPAQRLELKARRVELVEHIRYSLAAASEAEKSAVLAVTDQDSQAFADQAGAATAEVERLRKMLAGLLVSGASQKEKELLATFSEAFTNYQRVDRDLLALAVKNTNVKAFALAFGPAAQASKETDSALSRFQAMHATSPQKVLLRAASAQAATLRLETRLAPHIAEESDQKMDELEALMANDDREVRAALDGLNAQPGLRADPDLATARSSYARFSELRVQILGLSRENTNVRSLAISLNQKRKVMTVCQDALYALQREIAEEPAPVAPSNPRHLSSEPQTAH